MYYDNDNYDNTDDGNPMVLEDLNTGLFLDARGKLRVKPHEMTMVEADIVLAKRQKYLTSCRQMDSIHLTESMGLSL